VQLFDANGNMVGSPQQLPHTDSWNSPIEIQSVGSQGNYVVVWEGDVAVGGKHTYVQEFNSLGTAVTQEMTLGTAGVTDNASASQLATNSIDKSFAVVAVDKTASDWGLVVNLYDQSGTKIGQDISIGKGDGVDQFSSEIAKLDNGHYVVTWVTMTGRDIYYQEIDAQGNFVDSSPVKINSSSDINYAHPVVTPTGSNGEFIISYDGPGSRDTRFHVYKEGSSGSTSSTGDSNEVGTLYLVNDSLGTNFSSLSSLNAILTVGNDVNWNSWTESAPGTAASLDTTGLASGFYHLYASDVAGNLSLMSIDAYHIL
jgi:hypothetical protein